MLVELWPYPKKCILKTWGEILIEGERKRVVLSRTLARSLVNEKAKWRDESERPNRTEERRRREADLTSESSYLQARFGSENDPMRVKTEIKCRRINNH